MFGKSDLVDSLNRDLARARNKRDALTSGVATLTAQIAELETRLSAENERRRRERAASEIEGIKKRVRDGHSTFVPAIAAICNATEVAAPIIPEAREFNDLLEVIATEVANATHGLLVELDRRIEAVRAGDVAPELLRSLKGSPELPQKSDRVHYLSETLTKEEKEESAELAAIRRAASCVRLLKSAASKSEVAALESPVA
jgi:septal ring factor EnvC (AmiA/AmiB activator)